MNNRNGLKAMLDSVSPKIDVPYETDWEFVSHITITLTLLCLPVLFSLLQ